MTVNDWESYLVIWKARYGSQALGCWPLCYAIRGIFPFLHYKNAMSLFILQVVFQSNLCKFIIVVHIEPSYSLTRKSTGKSFFPPFQDARPCIWVFNSIIKIPVSTLKTRTFLSPHQDTIGGLIWILAWVLPAYTISYSVNSALFQCYRKTKYWVAATTV